MKVFNNLGLSKVSYSIFKRYFSSGIIGFYRVIEAYTRYYKLDYNS